MSMSSDEAMLSASLIFMNTNLAAAVSTCVVLAVTWILYKKPDVSMCLNGALAGLVAITAGCDVVDPFGAFFIGFAAGILVVASVEFFDKTAKIDDPVGAISVHGACEKHEKPKILLAKSSIICYDTYVVFSISEKSYG